MFTNNNLREQRGLRSLLVLGVLAAAAWFLARYSERLIVLMMPYTSHLQVWRILWFASGVVLMPAMGGTITYNGLRRCWLSCRRDDCIVAFAGIVLFEVILLLASSWLYEVRIPVPGYFLSGIEFIVLSLSLVGVPLATLSMFVRFAACHLHRRKNSVGASEW